MTTQEIEIKIKKLLALAGNNPSREEAAAALAKAQALMTEHHIEQLQVTDVEEDDLLTFWDKDDGISGALWKSDLAYCIARANNCFCYTSGKSIGVCGKPSNIKTANYIVAYCITQINSLSDSHAKGLGRSYVNSFKLGCVHAIREAIERERKESEARMLAIAAASNDCRAVVRLDNALAISKREYARAESTARSKVKLRSVSSPSRKLNGSGYRAGKTAGAGIYGSSKGSSAAKRIA